MEVIYKDEFEKLLINQLHISQEDMDIIYNCFVDTMFDCIREGKTIHFGDGYSKMKVKKSVAKLNEGSPRTPRKDHFIVTMKVAEK